MLGEILLLILFFSFPTQTTSNAYDDADAYEVYATILPSEWPLRVAHAKKIVIRRETRFFQMCLKPDPESEARFAPAIADYIKQNKKKWVLQKKFSLATPYQFFEGGFDDVVKQGGWEQYYRQYQDSGGLIEFSAVGFNADKTVAVVYMGHGCGSLCGGGGFHTLEKVDGKWKPFEWKGQSCGWAS